MEKQGRNTRRALILSGALLAGAVTAGCDDKELPDGPCASDDAKHGAYAPLSGKPTAVEITVTPPTDPASFEGYVFGYQYPETPDRSKWEVSDLMRSPDATKEASYIVKLGEGVVALSVWTQSEAGSEDCLRHPIAEFSERMPEADADEKLAVVTWGMSETIPPFEMPAAR